MKFHFIPTLDYELFGDGSGCLEKCLVDPVTRCVQLFEQQGARLTFFVETLEFDCYRTLVEGGRADAETTRQYAAVADQLSSLHARGHELALHLHPQWTPQNPAHARFELDFSKWRLGDLTASEVAQCVDRGMKYLGRITGQSTAPQRRISTFRAGGWAIQPGGSVLEALSSKGVLIDSTVAPGLHNPAWGDWYDFRNAPERPYWKIDRDVCRVAEIAQLLEVPIATHRIGRYQHARALAELRTFDAFPAGCHGSYAGPNGPFDALRGKLGKLLNLGIIMLDFSHLPAWALIEATRGYMKKFSRYPGPIPIVAIGHNKNFSNHAARHLQTYLDWLTTLDDLGFSSYNGWHEAWQSHAS